jgi:hypothetical protein
MLEWLVQNRQWVFSGVGLTVLAGVWYGVRRLLAALHAVRPAQLPPFDQEKFRARPLPSEVGKQVEAAPPFYREDRGREFEGLRVQWRLELRHAERKGDDTIGLILGEPGKLLRVSVHTRVPLDRYPDLKVAQPGTIIWVAGTISECSPFGGGMIALSEVELRIIL